MPIPQGGGDGGNGDDGSESDIAFSPQNSEFSPTNVQATTAGQHRTTSQTRQTRFQTLGNNAFNVQDEAPIKLDTSLLGRFSSSNTPVDTLRGDSANPRASIFSGKLAAPGLFSQLPELQSSTPWEYKERLPSELQSSSVKKLLKSPQFNLRDSNLSTPDQSKPPSIKMSGTQEGIYRNDMQPGYQNLRGKLAMASGGGQYTTPISSSRWVQYPPSNAGNGGAGANTDLIEQEFVTSYRKQYPQHADTISFVDDADPHVITPEKQPDPQFKFTGTPRINVPPLVNFAKGVGGSGGIGPSVRRESDLLPSDLENVLSHFVESTNGLSKASCDVTDFDCIEGEDRQPLAAQIHTMEFQVRNPGKGGGTFRPPTISGSPSDRSTQPVKVGFGGGPKGGPRMTTMQSA
ncbi:hypothetical protein ABW20_dc0103141 [Dactylellina cionopaga]|nr:hypothetical protein ABW20_dc0103141 [Dactylellina cionopaga]